MLKVGMVGVGAISGIYLENLTKTFQEVQLVAVCDLIRERAENAKAKYQIPKLYDTMYELFCDPEIDIVLNLTRPDEHYDVTKAALEAGKHVYTEKPLASTFELGKELFALAEAKGLAIGGAPDTFLGAGIQTCRAVIESGMIGDPIGGAAFMICSGHESWHPDPEFYYKRGGGPMMDMGPYYVTALIHLLGRVDRVTGIAKKTFEERIITSQPHAGEIIKVDVPTYVTGMLQFSSGTVATIFTTFDVVYQTQARLEIYGTKGTLFVPDPNTFGGPVKILRSEDGTVRELPLLFDYHENSRGLGLADLAKSIETGRGARASGRQILHALEIMESFYKSSDAGKAVALTTTYTPERAMAHNPLHGVLDD